MVSKDNGITYDYSKYAAKVKELTNKEAIHRISDRQQIKAEPYLELDIKKFAGITNGFMNMDNRYSLCLGGVGNADRFRMVLQPDIEDGALYALL